LCDIENELLQEQRQREIENQARERRAKMLNTIKMWEYQCKEWKNEIPPYGKPVDGKNATAKVRPYGQRGEING